ncbi:hypothetical protein [Streptomyces sp. NPDC048825]|uniref:hypothetical protein n=1 Tax=Streptomyces sp. NPDC048825 TaxID=3365592 RepID=UPI003716139B
MSTYAVSPAQRAPSHRRRRNRTLLLVTIGITALAVLAYVLVRPDSAKAAGEDLEYVVNADGTSVAFFDQLNDFEVQMDLTALKQETGTAERADVEAAFAEANKVSQEVTGWNLEKDIPKMKAEAKRFRDEIAGADFGNVPEENRLKDMTVALFENSKSNLGAECRDRCLASPIGTTVARTVFLGGIATIAALTLSAVGVAGLPAAGIMVGIVWGVNLMILATELFDRQRANADAAQQAAVRQQANHALVQMMTLGRTAVEQAVEQAGGDRNRVNVQAERTARSAYARQNGGDPQPEPDQAFIDQMDMILDQV